MAWSLLGGNPSTTFQESSCSLTSDEECERSERPSVRSIMNNPRFRFLDPGATGSRLRGSPHSSDTSSDESSPLPRRGTQRPGVGLQELSDGPYLSITEALDAKALCALDRCCKGFRQLNSATGGPWRALGARMFAGLDLEKEGTFLNPLRPQKEKKEKKAKKSVAGVFLQACQAPSIMESVCGVFLDNKSAASSGCSLTLAQPDWKRRTKLFNKAVQTFAPPFKGKEIKSIDQPDEIAYLRSRLCSDLLDHADAPGRYVEVEVLVNPNNLSMAVVDFEEGGSSSVTFSPDTGAVIRESKVQESPRKVEGAYIQTLPVVTTGKPFHGIMGLYLYRGRLAFFRQCIEYDQDGLQGICGPWETTGYVTDLSWAEGNRLTPCLAFRDNGNYHVRILTVGSEPPIRPDVPVSGVPYHGDTTWSRFDWEGLDAVEGEQQA